MISGYETNVIPRHWVLEQSGMFSILEPSCSWRHLQICDPRHKGHPCPELRSVLTKPRNFLRCRPHSRSIHPRYNFQYSVFPCSCPLAVILFPRWKTKVSEHQQKCNWSKTAKIFLKNIFVKCQFLKKDILPAWGASGKSRRKFITLSVYSHSLLVNKNVLAPDFWMLYNTCGNLSSFLMYLARSSHVLAFRLPFIWT